METKRVEITLRQHFLRIMLLLGGVFWIMAPVRGAESAPPRGAPPGGASAGGIVAGYAHGAAPQLQAEAAVLMDYTTGALLYQKNADQQRPPASTTKILTAIVALERGKLNQVLTASAKAAKVGGSSIWLAPGERHSLQDLLYGLLLSSGNDAAVTVAEGLAGTEANFVAWMNQKALDLGASNSHFVNPNGLPESNHYSTAHDLAIITRYALQNQLFAQIVKTKQKVMVWPGHKTDRVMFNHNKLLWRYQYADGVKTGYTIQAGNCLVSTAIKDGHRLIVVVMRSKNIYGDSEDLFEYGFSNYQLLAVVSLHSRLGLIKVDQGTRRKVSVSPERPLTLVLPKKEVDQLQVNLQMPAIIAAPVEKAQPVGELEVKLGEHLIDEVPLVTTAEVPREGLWRHFCNWLQRVVLEPIMESVAARWRNTARAQPLNRNESKSESG